MSSRMGRIAEHKFELMCLERDIPIFKPVIDNYGIDFIIQRSKKSCRIQVKSTLKKDPARNTYKVNVVRGFDGRKYEKGTYDYLVIHIFDLGLWYIIPEKHITAKTIRVNPNSTKGKYSIYKERWDLLI